MQISIAIGLCVMNLLLLLTVIFGLPGIWLMLLATGLVAWWQPDMIGWGPLLAMGIVALLAEGVEFVAGLLGAAKAGGGWLASLGALGGGLLGAIVGTFVIPIPLLGTLIGACAGAGFGAYALHLADKRPEQAAKVGVAAGVGRLVGTIVKMGLGIVVWIIAAVAAFWP